ncbi:hypothetical protein LJB87_00660 [Alistipes sp. OttesenSCG-928-L06]|nr:hypothetical protein [Alistipes sp. OttesenSCG-928-L06]
MKTNFKLFALAALALTLGFSSCSNNDDDAPDGQKRVTVKINVSGISTRAVGSTAVGVTPTLSDLTLFFVGNNIVQKVETVSSPSSGTTGTFTVPNATTKVYALGNVSAQTSPTSLPTAGAAEADVQKLMLEVNKQGGMIDTDFDPALVNLTAGKHATVGTAYNGVTFDGSNDAEFDIVPAISRYEIKKVSSANTIQTGVTQPLSSFELKGIYITNTYRTVGIDYTTVPTAAGDIINDGPNVGTGAAGAAAFAGAIPAYLQDAVTGAAALSFQPAGPSTSWNYFVMPVNSTTGTTLKTLSDPESAMPIIVLRIDNATSTTVTNPPTYASPSYINVRKFVLSSDGTPVNVMEPGKAYVIDEIVFGGEHLTEIPAVNHEKSVTVKVTVKPWTGVGVKPEL